MFHQTIVQVLVPLIERCHVMHTGSELPAKLFQRPLSRRVIVQKTVYMTVSVQQGERLGEIGHGIQYNAVRLSAAGQTKERLFPQHKEGKVVHKPFKQATDCPFPSP